LIEDVEGNALGRRGRRDGAKKVSEFDHPSPNCARRHCCPFHRAIDQDRYDRLTVSGKVNQIIASAINANPAWFWEGADA
jgi:hypothetical protein